MSIPTKNKDEDKNDFMQRCMGDEVMKKEYPDQDQRTAICMSKAIDGLSQVEALDFCATYGKKKFKYRNPKTNEYFYYDRRGIYKKDGITLVPDFDEDDE
jgi:hypothetical protein